jgi:hypothetical protein
MPSKANKILINIGNQKLQKQSSLYKDVVINLGNKIVTDEAYIFENDPIGFAYFLGIKELTAEQKQIMLSVRDRSTTNVQAAHGVGKSHVAAIIALWWVFSVGGRCVTTAPTARQVKEVLWSEIRSHYDANKHKLGGRRGELFVNKTVKARATGFTARDNCTDAFQGVHDVKLLVIEDEANGISPAIDDGASSLVTGVENRILRIGNPTSAGTPFHKSCMLSHIRIPAWNHPNVAWAYQQCPDGVYRLVPAIAQNICQDDKDEPVKPQKDWPPEYPRDRIPGAVSISWIEKHRIKKGEQSPFFISRVNAYFPEDNTSSLIPRSWFIRARARYDADPLKWDNLAHGKKWRFGLDVGDGGDAHALAAWHGPVLYFVRNYPTLGDGEDTIRAAALAKKELDKKKNAIVSVDRAGVGAGTYGKLCSDGYRISSIGVHWGEQAKDKEQFLNLKAEDAWILREAFENEEVAIAPLGNLEDEVIDDLASTWYQLTANDKTRVEDKKKTKERLGRSPNCGDAVILGYRYRQTVSDMWT